jgi:hypothetical protein
LPEPMRVSDSSLMEACVVAVLASAARARDTLRQSWMVLAR